MSRSRGEENQGPWELFSPSTSPRSLWRFSLDINRNVKGGSISTTGKPLQIPYNESSFYSRPWVDLLGLLWQKKKKNRIRKRGGGRLAFCRAELCCISDLLTSPSLREMCVSAVLWRHKWTKIKETLAAQENPNCHVQLRTVIFRLKSGSGYTWGIVLKSTEIITKTLCFHWGGSRVLWL